MRKWLLFLFLVPVLSWGVNIDNVFGTQHYDLTTITSGNTTLVFNQKIIPSNAYYAIYRTDGKSTKVPDTIKYNVVLTVSKISTKECPVCHKIDLYDLSTTLFNQEYSEMSEAMEKFVELKGKYFPQEIKKE